MNQIAILVAGIAAWVVGGAWYGVLGQNWLAALGKTRAEVPGPLVPMVLSVLADLVMAFVLASTLGPAPGLAHALGTAALLWLGFVFTTILVNNAFAGRTIMLTVIDSGHWLAALLTAGLVLSLMG